jgi:hypothetical protein
MVFCVVIHVTSIALDIALLLIVRRAMDIFAIRFRFDVRYAVYARFRAHACRSPLYVLLFADIIDVAAAGVGLWGVKSSTVLIASLAIDSVSSCASAYVAVSVIFAANLTLGRDMAADETTR